MALTAGEKGQIQFGNGQVNKILCGKRNKGALDTSRIVKLCDFIDGTHGDITGVTAGTGLTGGGTTGTVTLAVAYGTTATTACVGNDSRLSDDRDPNAHAASHATAAVDAIAPADIGAATAADLDAQEARAIHILAPVIADWDPTDIGAGVVDPPTSVAGDRYIASATEAPYTTPRIYEYDGAAWVETAGDNGDVIFHEDDNVTKIFDGAGWRNVYDSANLLAFTGDSGAGGAIGLVPAPAAGDAAAGKYLDADGTWTVPPTSSAADAVLGDQARRSTSTPQSTATGTPTKITFETAEVEGDVTYLTGDFTVPEDGVYAVTASLTFAASAGGSARYTRIYVDGAAFKSDDAGPDGSNPVTVKESTIAYLAASSVIAIYGEQDSGGDLDVTAGRVAVQRVQ